MSRSASTFQVLLVLATTVAQTQWASVSGMYCNDLTPNVERPHSASITDFGAVGDGTTLNTKAFQNALFYLNSFANKGGAQLFVPAGRWLTGSFSLISHLTLSLDKDAVILGSPDSSDWPVIDALPSYGRGRELPGKRHQSLIFGSNLTDVIITGANSTIDGQGAIWWDWFHNHTLNYTRPPLVELMYSTRVVISNLTFINSPFWNIHPVYCSQVLVQHLTILAPISSPNTDGIDPDSSTNVCIEDCYIRNGDDIVVIKSGWDEYGISFAHPSSNISIRNITGQTRNSAGIAFGSEMSGGISDVRAEGIRIVNSVHGIRIKTAPGRGGYVKNVYVADVNLDNVSIAIRITGNYGEHPDENYNRNALPTISNITIKNIVGVNIGVAGMLQGISGDNFSNICLSNVSLSVRSTNPWNCSLVEGYSNSVSPEICEQLRTGPGPGQVCYDGNSYPAAAAQPQSPQKSSACRLGLLRNFIIPNPPAEPAYMGQRLAVASTSEDQLDQRPATADVDSPWRSYGSTIRSISFPQGVGWSAWLRQSGGSGTTPGSSLLSSCTDGSRPSSSASSWGSGAAGFNAIKANELRLIARRMVRDGHLQVLTREFLGGGNGVLQGWFTELDVDWVLTMTEDMSWRAEQMVVHDRARRWIRAFTTMAHAFLAIRSDLRHAVEGANEQELQLSGFASASISKMMLFVDAVIANVDWTPENLPVALDVYICISDTTASSHDQASSTAQQIVLSIYGATAHHTRRRRLAAAIHRAMRSLSVDYYGDGGSCGAPRGSELHATTRYTMDFVRLLWRNAGLASSVLDDDGSGSVVLLVSDVMRCWEFSLVSASMLLPDATLRCVFLLNNYDAMAEAFPDSGLHDEIGRCMEHYLDAAWAPVLSCLHSAPVWPPSAKLANFTARFWRTYNAQKLWRVPSPALRGRLRRAVAGLVISAYAMYLKEHPLRDKDRVSIMAPEEMEEILNELFEG